MEIVWLIVFVWAIKSAADKGRGEYRATRDQHAAQIAREHKDWHPRRVQHAAGRRAQSYWWHELTHAADGKWRPFPTFRAGFAEDRLLAKVTAAEAHAGGITRRRELTDRLNTAKAARDAADAPPDGTVPPLPADSVERAPTRRIDGQPETEAEGRFFDTRESGYDGAIDRDGYPVMTRTAPDGTPLPLFEGGTGTGTPDDQAALVAAHNKRFEDDMNRHDPLPLFEGGTGTGTPDDRLFDGDPFDRHSPAYAEAPDKALLHWDDPLPPTGTDDPFPPAGDGWPTGQPRRDQRNGRRPLAAVPDHPPATEGTPMAAAATAERPPSPGAEMCAEATTSGGPMTAGIDTSLESGDTPHEAMQSVFRQFAGWAARTAAAASDDLAAAAAVHGYDRDPQVMADIADIADHAEALRQRADQARTGLAGRHADGAEYHANGQDADASAFRPS